ncbi:MAG TPA: tripartite tricarboxylate transporter substrate binding protein [Burkholderiales bacterium]
MHDHHRRRLLGAAAATALAAAPLRAQGRPMTLITGYAPGGGADIMARLIAVHMGPILGDNVIVDNKPGTAGQIGAAYVAHSTPNGSVAFVDAASFAINLALYPKLPYTQASFETVGVIATLPLVVLVHPSLPVKSMQDLIAYARSKPGEVFYASSGNGSLMHLTTSLFARDNKLQMTHIPYKGGGQAMTDVLAGQVKVYFCNAVQALPYVKSGRVRALAVTTATRSKALPDVPTLKEAGVPGIEMMEWNGLYMPAGTPAPVVDRVANALQQTLKKPEVRKSIEDLTAEPFTGNRAEAVAFVNSQVALMARVVKELGIKPDQ